MSCPKTIRFPSGEKSGANAKMLFAGGTCRYLEQIGSVTIDGEDLECPVRVANERDLSFLPRSEAALKIDPRTRPSATVQPKIR